MIKLNQPLLTSGSPWKRVVRQYQPSVAAPDISFVIHTISGSARVVGVCWKACLASDF